MGKAGRPKKDTVKNNTVNDNKKVETQIENIKEKQESNISETNTKTRKQAVQIDRNEMIPCRSAVYGRLTYVSTRTGLMTVWNDFGTVEYVEYGELISMRASQPKFLTKPWIIVEDEEAVSTISGLKELYDEISKIGDDLEVFFKKNPKEIEDILNKVPNGTKALIASKAREMMENGTLYDVRVINVIDKIMNTGLKDFIR